MFNNPWIRKPDFSQKTKIDYNEYWQRRGWQIATSLKPREKIILNLIPKGKQVLDIGCGNSLLPLKLKQEGLDVKVADISDLVVEEYRKIGVDSFKINLSQLDLSRVPQVDYLIMSEVLEHLVQPEEVISLLKVRTKYFILTIPNSAAYQFRYGLLVRGRFFTQWLYHPSEHLRFWSHLDFLDWLRSLGLEVIRSDVADGFSFRGRLPWLPALWKNLLGFRMVYLCRVEEDSKI